MTKGRGGSGERPARLVRPRKSRQAQALLDRVAGASAERPLCRRAARRRGYRSRAAFKLIELDDRFHLLRPGRRVVDLGCAPGGWTQVAVERVGARGRVLGVDLAEIATACRRHAFYARDLRDPSAAAVIGQALGGRRRCGA